jgi:ribonuclease HI
MTTNNTFGRSLVLAIDGACLRNPGPGGWAVIAFEYQGDTLVSRSAVAGSAKRSTTNCRSELKAGVEALRLTKDLSYSSVTILSDSQYVTKGASEYLAGWKANGWRKSDRKPVLNKDLWEQLDSLAEGLDVSWKWVKGHSGHPMNEAADTLASDAAAGLVGSQDQLRQSRPELFSE